ncbi:MAG: Hsp70 family protein [Oligoflexus sp.]
MNKKSARFIIGIDLGTTHCALSYFDRFEPEAGIQSFAIPQWDGDEGLVAKYTLPSFLYLLTKGEIKRQEKRLPFDHQDEEVLAIVGREARERLSSQADRVIHSAKSWLCHGGINRSSKILPWQSEEILGDQRWSPVEVEAAFLRHLRLAWDAAFSSDKNPENSLAAQDLLVTVPASFDEAAQRLTLEACRLAGLGEHLRLMEEPQAAFFDWLLSDAQWSPRLEKLLADCKRSSAKVLVCDVGGGTSDFSILEVSKQSNQKPQIKRLKVSNHILLGGDNIDLAIAHRIDQQRKHQEHAVRASAWSRLVNEARKLKESLLQSDEQAGQTQQQNYFVTIDQAGASLFDSTETISIDPAQIQGMILDGFYPLCDASDRPHEKPRSGISEWGLPYAQDSAITRHLAAFLDHETIDAVIFAGGSLTPKLLRQRICQLIGDWQKQPILDLQASSLDLAVSRGATAFAFLHEQEAGLVTASYPRSVFLKVEQQGESRLLRLIPRGSPIDSSWSIKDLKLLALVNQNVEFEVWTSATDQGKSVGETVSLTPDFHRLPPMHTVLSYPEKKHGQIAVELTATISNTGLLQIFCNDRDEQRHQWSLEFHAGEASLFQGQKKQQTGPSLDAGLSPIEWQKIDEAIRSLYGKKKGSDSAMRPQELIATIEKILHKEKQDWSLPQLRVIWESLQQGLTRRQRSVDHETSWLQLAGYSLRPGFGASRDPDRCREIWRCWQLGLAHPKDSRVLDQWWIMWRRVAGGLNQEQQNTIFDRIFPQLRKAQSEQASREMLLLAGSLERIEMNRKLQLGRSLVSQISSGQKQLVDAKIWALAHLASRVPLYAGVEDIIQPVFVEQWIDDLHHVDIRQKHYRSLQNFYSQAGRRLNQRDLDLSPAYRQVCLNQLEKAGAEEQLRLPISNYLPPDKSLFNRLFGEDLPTGIEIVD